MALIAAHEGGKQLGEVSENDFTFLIYTDYSYYYNSKKTETVNFPNETIAICTACTPRQDIIIPSSVTWNGVKYPVKVIGDNAELKPLYHDRGEGHPQCLTIPASVEVLEYNTFGLLERATTRLIVEDTNVRLLCSPSRMGLGWLEGGGRRGIFAKLLYLEDAYIGRDLKNATTDKEFEPFFSWPYVKQYGGHGENLSITFGHHVKSLSAGYFGNFLGKKLTLTFEQLGIVDCGNAWPGKDMDVSCNMRVYAGYGNEYKLKEFYRQQRNDINISDLPDSGTSGGTKWGLVAIGSIKDGTCTGYKMTISPSGNGIMEDKNNASEYGWYDHHKVIHELNIESGVTHLSKLGWDGYPLKAIYVLTQNEKSLPTIGADAFRGVNNETPVYAYSKVRTILQNQADWKACFKDFRDLDIKGFVDEYIYWIKAIAGNAKDGATQRLVEQYLKMANGFTRWEQIEDAKNRFLHQLFNQDGDGSLIYPYAIATADQLMCFAHLTAMNKYLSVCGKLTADINAENYGSDVMLGKTQQNAYMGTLDGQGHSVNIGFASETSAALIGVLGGTVKNLVVTGGLQLVISNKANSLGGVVACCFKTATVENCISKVTMTGPASLFSCGGIVGKTLNTDGNVTIRNCAFLGKISFDNLGAQTGVDYCGGIVGRAEAPTLVSHCYTAAEFEGKFSDNCANIAQIGKERITLTVERCYYLNALGSSKQGKELDEQERTTGQWCYMLNDSVSDGSQAWYQKIGNDDYPHPFSRGEDTVYRQNESYTNAHTTHTFGADGFCTVCGAVDPNHQGAYQVSTAGQWKHLAAYVDKDHCKFDIELMKDIDLTCIGNAAMVGKLTVDNAFKGNFDGHGHSLTINLVSPEDRVGLFRGTHHATIKNLEVEGNITCSQWYIGGIIGDGFWETNLQNCISEVNITCTWNKDGSSGGLIGICNSPLTINNCAFTGKLIGNNTSRWGGLVGWVCEGAPTITNSYVYATTENISTDGCCTFARVNNNQYQNIKDCYYVTPLGDTQGGKQVKEAEAKSGYLCYDLLNHSVMEGKRNWYQALEIEQPEVYPYPFSQGGDTVYYDKNENKYTNTRPTHHHFVNGFCTECGAIDPNAKEVTISSKDNVRRWAEWVNAGHGDVSVKLAMNLSDNDELFTIGKNVTYTGTFDGQGHRVIVDYNRRSIIEPAMWANFAGTLRNTYFELIIPRFQSDSTPKVNNLAPFENFQGTIECCLFRAYWRVGNGRAYRLGGLINTISGQTCFKDCAFLGFISVINLYGFEKVCKDLFIRDVNKNLTTFTNCFEDVYYSVYGSHTFSYDRFIPNATSSPANCHVYGGEYDSHGDNHNIRSQTLDDLNGMRNPLIWKWADVDELFKHRPVPFFQYWNEREEDLPQILAPAQRAINKYMEDGHIVIQRGNTYYDIFGREL